MDFDDWPAELQDFWENTTGLHQGYMTFGEMQEFIDQAEGLFDAGWGHDGDDDTRQDARDAFFELMAEFDLDVSMFDWDDWRDWYESV